LADWVDTYNLYSETNRYLIQVPRLYDTWKSLGSVKSFADVLRNIFEPLFEATLNPSAHRVLTRVLTQVSGFDCVDDESKVSSLKI
jgi:AMP deaminase